MDPALFQENERLERDADERRFADLRPFACESGETLPSLTVAFETWGKLAPSGDNAVLVCHALTGDSHAVGWWERIVGPGKPVDTNRWFVICANTLGGCQGTTGPPSTAPDGKPYGSRFPNFTLGDTVEVFVRLLESLGIERLHAVCGGSMGGMQGIELSVRRPGFVKKVWATASCAAHNAGQIGFNEAQRQAVMRDPKWRGGDYPLDDPPRDGLAVSRMIAHLMFLSDASLEAKFGRRRQPVADSSAPSHSNLRTAKPPKLFQVESYLNHQGEKFTRRFDANSFIWLTRAMNEWERTSLDGSTSEYLFTSFTSDRLYPSSQSAELHRMALAAGCQSRWIDIDLPYGHDAFLLDAQHQGEAARRFLGDE